MLNINGFGKSGFAAPVGGHGKDSAKGVGKKPEEKKKNTDRAEFSSFMGGDKGVGAAGGIEVGAVSDKLSGLSSKAQAYLEKLKKKYGSMDFIIQDYSTDEEADKLLEKGKGEYNVLITPDLLEKMADDEDTAAEYEAMIDKSVEAIDGVKTGLGEDADMVSRYGVTFDGNGNMSIRALLAGDLTGSDGSSTVKASTVEDMLKQLNEAKEAQAEKLAKMREERAKEAAEKEEEDENEADKEYIDSDVKVIRNDRGREASLRMNAVLSKEQSSELEALLEDLDGKPEVNGAEDRGRHHSHFSAKA
ncbi:MAG: hypothetical protein J6O50_04875 [Ruminiclostridium sp.]|nr:hypothetical protein [Ruminiclostridium sp.]